MSGKLWLALTSAGGVAAGRCFAFAAAVGPAIVDVHVDVTVVDQAGTDHGVGAVAHHLVGHAVGPVVPTIPAHLGGQVQGVAADELEAAPGGAQGVGGLEDHRVLAALVQSAGDVTGLGIDAQPRRQVFHGEGHGPLAGRRDGEEEGRAGTDAEDLGAVNPRRGRGRRRQNDPLLERGIDRSRLGAADQEAGVGPIAVREVDAAADEAHGQDQRLEALDVDVHRLGRLALVHDAGVEQRLAVAGDLEGDVIHPLRRLVDAHRGEEAVAAAGQIDPDDALGVGAHAVGEFLPAQAERRFADRAVDLGLAPTLLHLGQVQRAEPNGFRAARRPRRCGQQQAKSEADGETLGCNSHGDFSSFLA